MIVWILNKILFTFYYKVTWLNLGTHPFASILNLHASLSTHIYITIPAFRQHPEKAALYSVVCSAFTFEILISTFSHIKSAFATILRLA